MPPSSKRARPAEPAPAALATPFDVANTCHFVTDFLKGERSNQTQPIQCGRARFRLRDSISKWALEYYDPSAEAWTKICTTKKALMDAVCEVIGLEGPPSDGEPAEGDSVKSEEEEEIDDVEDEDEGAEGADGAEADDESNEDDPRQRASGRRRTAARLKPSPSTSAPRAAAAGSGSRTGPPPRSARRAANSIAIVGPPAAPAAPTAPAAPAAPSQVGRPLIAAPATEAPPHDPLPYDPQDPQANQLNVLVSTMTATAREIHAAAARSDKMIEWWNNEFARRQAAGESDAFTLKEALDKEALDKAKEFEDETEAAVRPLLDARDAMVCAVDTACKRLNEAQATLERRA
jgi:hypothetical protein